MEIIVFTAQFMEIIEGLYTYNMAIIFTEALSETVMEDNRGDWGRFSVYPNSEGSFLPSVLLTVLIPMILRRFRNAC